ncbi:hypothetical protein LXA43DRAFT_972750 [Ganoderma leucocontextum]|nr:hypothetical protein LXA43DRAFT_972750 [Ganoderma leucocontextum]
MRPYVVALLLFYLLHSGVWAASLDAKEKETETRSPLHPQKTGCDAHRADREARDPDREATLAPVHPRSHSYPHPPTGRHLTATATPTLKGFVVNDPKIPIKGFVHEVLRRSGTSTGDWSASNCPCYPEAVRSKVPECMEAPEPRIVQGVFEIEALDDPTIRIGDTVLVGDIDVNVSRLATTASCGKDESSLPPLPALPSPLCCPHRTFLACLILASKFIQDRSYSNWAWAKLAGLPPREIGRCERALGDALEWRLWVGKIPASSTSTSGMSSGRTVTWSRSDGDVVYTSTRSCTTPSTAVLLPLPRSWTGGVSRSAAGPAIGADCGSTVVDPFLAREALGPGYDATSRWTWSPKARCRHWLSTLSLSYSPMSSTSSSSDGSEDRTIHMSMFLHLPTPAMPTFGNNPGPWVASAFTYTPADPANPHGSFSPINAYTSCFNPSNPTHLCTKQVPHTLPSFAEVFSNPGMFQNGTQ